MTAEYALILAIRAIFTPLPAPSSPPHEPGSLSALVASQLAQASQKPASSPKPLSATPVPLNASSPS